MLLLFGWFSVGLKLVYVSAAQRYNKLTAKWQRLCAMVCYYGQHYMAFVLVRCRLLACSVCSVLLHYSSCHSAQPYPWQWCSAALRDPEVVRATQH